MWAVRRVQRGFIEMSTDYISKDMAIRVNAIHFLREKLVIKVLFTQVIERLDIDGIGCSCS